MRPHDSEQPPAYDDLDEPGGRRPRLATDDRAVIRIIRKILEEQQVPPELRQVFARAFYDDWVLSEAEAWQRWQERCRERSHGTGEE